MRQRQDLTKEEWESWLSSLGWEADEIDPRALYDEVYRGEKQTAAPTTQPMPSIKGSIIK